MWIFGKNQFLTFDSNTIKYIITAFLSLRLEGVETLKCRCVCQLSCGKVNTASSDDGPTQKYDFPVLNRKYPFSTNLVQKIKIVNSS